MVGGGEWAWAGFSLFFDTVIKVSLISNQIKEPIIPLIDDFLRL